MLRITVRESPGVLDFLLEGELAGSWIRETEDCRQRTLSTYSSQIKQKSQPKTKCGKQGTNASRRPLIRFDLTGVTFIDAAGKAYLAAMHHLGVEFISADCLTKAIVAEITNGIPVTRPAHQQG
jgi:hypothetical protein